MVKKAEKIRKRNPLLPIFGMIVAIGLGAIAYIVSSEVILKMPQVRTVVGANTVMAKWAFAFVVWLVLLGVAYFLVAMAAGKDPDAGKHMQLPTKQKDLPQELRRKTRRR
jgi:hypothetical protein